LVVLLTCACVGAEHTLLVTETGVEVLAARREDSPGGPVPIPVVGSEKASTNGA
jgi:methionyl aminopeptidase